MCIEGLRTTWIKEPILNENEMTPKPDENKITRMGSN